MPHTNKRTLQHFRLNYSQRIICNSRERGAMGFPRHVFGAAPQIRVQPYIRPTDRTTNSLVGCVSEPIIQKEWHGGLNRSHAILQEDLTLFCCLSLLRFNKCRKQHLLAPSLPLSRHNSQIKWLESKRARWRWLSPLDPVSPHYRALCPPGKSGIHA